jgi:hypothetical protein
MRTMPLVLVLAALGGSAGCGPNGSFTLSWAIAGETRSDAFGCSSHGIDGIQVQALHASSREPSDLVVFPCAPHFAEHKLDSGDYVLQVTPINARGQRLTDPRTGVAVAPVEVAATVPADGTVMLDPVTLTPNPACADGVDNDRDGLVDLADPDCGDALGESELPLPTP